MDTCAKGETEKEASPLRKAFRLVAIGASAGGLDALERLFDRIPRDTGAAFVVIQHLSPDHKSMMATLLARHTEMEIVAVAEGMELKANRIHLIPPGAILRLQGNLLTLAPKIPRILSLPIDEFLNSVAQSHGSETIAVILSGTGTDGTRGARAIHEAGGLLVAQSPQDARFDGMPASVIATGLVDRVYSADELGHWIGAILLNGAPLPLPGKVEVDLIEQGEDDPLNDILRVLGAASAIQFGDYKPGTIRRRIERRMLLRQAIDLAHYRDQLLTDHGEVEALRHEILVSVTSFFRDPESFKALAAEMDVLVREADAERRPLRIWSVATATGEEAYSLAILALESCDRQGIWPGVKVFATDVSGLNVEMASAGSFPESIAAEMAPDYVDRYFVLRQGRLSVRPELRQCMVFARHNALVDPPFTRIDLLSCRNMLIYLRQSAQDRVLRRLQYALRPGGVLFLGSSEMIGGALPAFEPVQPAHHIWRLSQHAPRPVLEGDRSLPLSRTLAPPDRLLRPGPLSVSVVDQAMKILQKTFAPPPALLLNGTNEIIHSFGEVAPFVTLRPGVASLDVLRLLPDPLVPVATAMLFRLRRMDDPRPQASHYVLIPASDGTTERLVRMTAIAVHKAEGTEAVLLVFEAMEADGSTMQVQTVDVGWETSERLQMLEAELLATRETLRTTIEEMEASNEEMQATNEEMMASNEELQSANEELQSVNEELNTVNAEFQEKIDILNRMHADLDGLTRVAPMGTIFVDETLNLTRYSPDTARIFRLREVDLGRPLVDLTHRLDYPNLIDDLTDALASGQTLQREVAGPENRRYLVRILPYRLPGSTRNAAVLSFVDITQSRTLRMMQAILDGFAATVAVLDRDGRIEMVNEAWRRFAVENGGDMVRVGPGSNYLATCLAAAGDEAAIRAAEGVRSVLQGAISTFKLEYPCDRPDLKRWFLMQVQALPEGFEGAVVSHFDVTTWKYPSQTQSAGG